MRGLTEARIVSQNPEVFLTNLGEELNFKRVVEASHCALESWIIVYKLVQTCWVYNTFKALALTYEKAKNRKRQTC
jgi:hypothetical protein